MTMTLWVLAIGLFGLFTGALALAICKSAKQADFHFENSKGKE